MEHCRAAERALVSALVLGAVDPRDLTGRLRPSDFTDPAASVVFETAMRAGSTRRLADELPALLRQQSRLRPDGYPISHLLEWLPRLPTPVHPEAWATLIVAGGVGRQVRASGDRLQQDAEAAMEGRCGTGRLLAAVAGQRAALAGSRRRWEDLPARWRASLPGAPSKAAAEPSVDAAVVPEPDDERVGREQALVTGLVAAPHLLGRIPWLDEAHFADPMIGEVFGTLRRLHEAGHAVDVVTLTAACRVPPGAAERPGPADVARELRPRDATPSSVPFLARHVLAHAIIDDVHTVGTDLVRLAQAPAAAGGVGSPLLAAAQNHLDRLRTHALRWENATRASATQLIGGGTVPERAGRAGHQPPSDMPVLDRHAS
jgi:replicative DNA helicase